MLERTGPRDTEAPSPSGRSGRTRFALLGAELGWIVPAAAFLLRVFVEKLPWRAELAEHAYFYAFAFAGTTLVLALFGGSVGGRIDSLRTRRDWYRDKSRRDDLTGFLTPSAFRQEFDRAISRSRETRSPLALLLVAVEGAAGSEARHGSGLTKALLIHVGAAVRRIAPPDAIVSRWGGLELAVLLPDAGFRLEDLSHRLSEQISERPVIDARTRYFCKATIGAYFGVPAVPLERVILQAQDALGEARRKGARIQIAG